MKSSVDQLHKRGYIEDIDIEHYMHLDETSLIDMLESDDSVSRTIAIRLLRKKNDHRVLAKLVELLVKERKLYTKIEASEAIAEYKADASRVLAQYLGKVGNNQHHELPKKPFEKKNYPLPRDIVARTICKIGIEALPDLLNVLSESEYSQKLEAIDAIGFISFYEKNSLALDKLLELLDEYKEDNVVVWKIIRAFQSFNDDKVKDILKAYLDSKVEQHQWEAERSLRQLKRFSK